MPFGPGKYDDLCTYVREKAEAGGACVMIYEGKEGWGFSMQAPLELLHELPGLLRYIASQIEKGDSQ
jgi:hypothetical protein